MLPSPNTQIKPLTFTTSSTDNMASVGGVRIDQLAKTYGTPLYILDETTLRTMMRTYKQAFSSYPGPLQVLYAAKANLCMGICAMVRQEGLGMDVVSGGELYNAIKSGFSLNDIVFNGNNKSRTELELAIAQGVGRISVDNFHELGLIDDIARQHGKKVPILIRITPGIECHTHDYIKTGLLDSKFGFDLTRLPQVFELLTTQYKDTLEPTGLHAHIGSQIFETRPFEDLVEVMLGQYQEIRERYNITMTHLNLGGGLGISYTTADDPPNVGDYATVIVNKLMAETQRLNYPLPTLILEPGRSLVATAGMTLYQVGSTKHIPQINKTYVAVDGGMGDNIRPALYEAVYTAIIANKPHESHTKTVTIAGKYCESGDILIRDLPVPESITAGDFLLVFDTGAYNYAMASNYNRVPRPAVVLVNNGHAEVLVKAETYDDLIAQDLIPAHLQAQPVIG